MKSYIVREDCSIWDFVASLKVKIANEDSYCERRLHYVGICSYFKSKKNHRLCFPTLAQQYLHNHL